MLVSLNEVRKYVDLNGISAQEIANKLTSAGIEVEGISTVASGTNLIIGKVIECVQHPSSDHLHVCKVDIGKDILQIVCGAPNCRQGLKVIVAQEGAELPGKTIKKGNLVGIDSCGMLCSLNELGVDPKQLRDEQVKGIEELPDDAVVGNENVLGYLGLDDVILDLSLLANRSDCYSIYNIGKELGALFGRKVTIPTYEFKDLKAPNFKVSSKTENCKAFYGRYVKGVEIKESPKWLKDVLRNEGIRSINNIVDIGNYAMLLTGQPINMYDADKLYNNELTVVDDFEGEVVAMDGNSYKAMKGDLVITSNGVPMCIAGIMTSRECEVTPETKNIFIEVANFYGPQIRKTCNRIGLTSDSSQRFAKGINPHQSEEVLDLIINLLKDLSGYEFATKSSVYDEIKHDLREIQCSYDYINNRLGTNYDKEQIKEILTSLYFKIKESTDGKYFFAIVPPFRIDVTDKADLSEEVIRFIGVDDIKSVLPEMVTTVGGRTDNGRKNAFVTNYFLSKGLYKIITYTLLNADDIERFNLLNQNDCYTIMNPITEDHKYTRKNLLCSMLRTVQYNYNHQNKDFGLFEISQINDLKESSLHLSVCLFGNKYEQDRIGARPYNFFDAKGLLEGLLKSFNVQNARVKYLRFGDSKELHPTRSAKVMVDGKLIAVLGELHPNAKDDFDLKKEATILMEVNLSALYSIKTSANKFDPISKFPSVTRDFAFILNKSTNYGDLRNEIKRSSSLISEVHVFDIYEGEHLEPGKISVAINVLISCKEHTLVDSDVNDVDAKIKAVVADKFGGLLR